MGKAWQAEIALDRVIEDKALHLAIFRYERDAFFDRLRRPTKTANLAADPEFQRGRRWASTQGCLVYTSETSMADRRNQLTASYNVEISK